MIRFRFPSSFAALALLFVAIPAAAQDAPSTAASASSSQPTSPSKTPSVSIALERAGGIAYAKASASESDSDVSVTTFGVGGATLNPFATPRVGVDVILPSKLTLGGAVGFSRISGSVSANGKTDDVGSVFLYTLTPRVGYRIALTDTIDFTPRAGLTFAGGSASPGSGNDSANIFAVALSADAPFAFRLTDSFNLLAGAALDYTVAAKVSSTTQTSSGTSTTSSTSKTDDVKGALFSMQAWVGVGGYL